MVGWWHHHRATSQKTSQDRSASKSQLYPGPSKIVWGNKTNGNNYCLSLNSAQYVWTIGLTEFPAPVMYLMPWHIQRPHIRWKAWSKPCSRNPLHSWSSLPCLLPKVCSWVALESLFPRRAPSLWNQLPPSSFLCLISEFFLWWLSKPKNTGLAVSTICYHYPWDLCQIHPWRQSEKRTHPRHFYYTRASCIICCVMVGITALYAVLL